MVDTALSPVTSATGAARPGGLVAPVATAAAVLFGTGLLAAVNPNTNHVPLCPLKAVTGLDCPFCGSLRAVHSLTRADIATAANHNIVFTASVPFLVLAWVWWFAGALGKRPAGERVSAWLTANGSALRWSGAALLLVFAVIRNVPAFGWLASTT